MEADLNNGAPGVQFQVAVALLYYDFDITAVFRVQTLFGAALHPVFEFPARVVVHRKRQFEALSRSMTVYRG